MHPFGVHRPSRGATCWAFCSAAMLRSQSAPTRTSVASAHSRFVRRKRPTRILRVDPSRAWSRSRVVTEFYRQYLAVAVFVVAAFAMVGAMLGVARLLRPTVPAGREVHHLRVGLRPAAALRAGERPLLHLRPAVRHLRRRGGLHLPVGDRRRRRSAGSGSIEMTVFVAVLLLGLALRLAQGAAQVGLISSDKLAQAAHLAARTTAASTRCGCSSGASRAARSRWAPRSPARATT